MKEKFKFIFDLDGTLYRFDKGQGNSFTSSRFYADLRRNVYGFLMERFGLTMEEAIAEYDQMKEKYRGAVSLGIESEYGVNRFDFFKNTWNLDPDEYIEKDDELLQKLYLLKGRIALLTNAPRIWADKVLAYLDIKDLFQERLYTGEPNERKPNSIVFQRIVKTFSAPAQNIFSIGDQEDSDIIPARNIGMRTLLVGPQQETVADYQAVDIKQAIDLLRREGFI